MRPLLAINCAEDRLQLALGLHDGGRLQLWAFQEWTAPGRANPLLAPAVQQMLTAFALAPRDLAGVACVVGPGSFTGVRMSLAFAEGLRLAAGVPLASLAYPALLARTARERLHDPLAPLCVLTHARKGLCHAQIFHAGGASDIEVLPTLRTLMELPLTATDTAPCLLCGSALRQDATAVQELLQHQPRCSLLPDRFDHPDGPGLLAAAVAADYAHAPLPPLYLRPSDAEANLEAIALAKGMDPASARRTLTELTNT